MTIIMRDMERDTSSELCSGYSTSCVISRTVGIEMHSTASSSKPKLNVCALWEYFCSGYLMPPTRKAQPSTSSRFDRIEPSRLTCTMRSMPPKSATSDTISSVTLPKVAFRRPPTVSDVCIASCSVTKLTRSAMGAIASTERTKTVTSSPP